MGLQIRRQLYENGCFFGWTEHFQLACAWSYSFMCLLV